MVRCDARLAAGIASPAGAVGLRCSPHPVAAALAALALRRGVGPLTATSLNRSGERACRTRAEAEALAGVELSLVAGLDAGGAEASSVVDASGAEPIVLREGALSGRAIAAALRGSVRMTDIRPFRALRYDPRRVELAKVLAPVYDVVAPEDRPLYWERDPYNALRLELTKSVEEEAATDYTETAERLAAWRREGVLVRDAEPALYVLRQTFTAPDGRALSRTGFLAALRLEDYARRIVRPHERTLAGPKADRLKILRATRVNLSSVFLLYEDRANELDRVFEAALAGPGVQEARDDGGIQHRLAPLRDAAAVEAVRAFLEPRPVVIADGHHRYETALAFRDESARVAPASRDGPGGAARAHPRLLRERLRAGQPAAPDPSAREEGAAAGRARCGGGSRAGRSARSRWARPDAIPAALAEHLAPLSGRHAFAADDGSGRVAIFSKPADAELTVRVLHREVLAGLLGLDDAAVRDGAVDFPKSALQTARDVRAGRGALALYLNPLGPDDVFRVTEAGETLPQKSTFFYPKLPTGLLFRSLEPE